MHKRKSYESSCLDFNVFVFTRQVVSGKVFDSTFVLASALHHMVLDGYDVTGEDVRFNFNEGRVLPWRNGEDLMKYIKKVGLFH